MNTQRLDELRAEVGDEAFGDVIDLFLAETDARATALGAGVDPSTLCDDMHFLKGVALNLGLDELAEACKTAEQAARAGRPEAVDVPEILALYAAGRRELVVLRASLDG